MMTTEKKWKTAADNSQSRELQISDTTSANVLWTTVPTKLVFEITYYVSSGTFNLTNETNF